MDAPVVVKLGGSLIGARDLDQVIAAIGAARGPVVVVPGGGAFAEAVRDAQRRLSFSDRLAHRLAIGAMGSFAAILAERDRRLIHVSERAEIAAAHAAGLTPLWDAAELAAGHPAIPESWEVTSDSLAAWLAAELRARGLILIKSAAVATGIATASELAAAGIVDRAFPDFAAACPGPIRCLGPPHWTRVGEAIRDPAAAIGLEVASSGTGLARRASRSA